MGPDVPPSCSYPVSLPLSLSLNLCLAVSVRLSVSISLSVRASGPRMHTLCHGIFSVTTYSVTADSLSRRAERCTGTMPVPCHSIYAVVYGCVLASTRACCARCRARPPSFCPPQGAHPSQPRVQDCSPATNFGRRLATLAQRRPVYCLFREQPMQCSAAGWAPGSQLARG